MNKIKQNICDVILFSIDIVILLLSLLVNEWEDFRDSKKDK